MRIKRFLWGLAPTLNVLFVILESALGGGAFYALKTGSHLGKGGALTESLSSPPSSWQQWWDFIPSVGVGTVGPICAVLVVYKVISDPKMDSRLRRILWLVFWYYTLAYTSFCTIYVLSQPEHLTFTQTLDKFDMGAWTPYLTWWLLSGNFFLPGAMLAAMAHDERAAREDLDREAQEEMAKEKREQVMTYGEERAAVIEAVRESTYAMLTRNEIQEATGLTRGQVDRIAKALVNEGVLRTDGAARNTKFILVDL